jgi:hypothetical protein
VIRYTIKSLPERWEDGPAYRNARWGPTIPPYDCLCGISRDHLIDCFEIGVGFWRPGFIDILCSNSEPMLVPRDLRELQEQHYEPLQEDRYGNLAQWLAVVRTASGSRGSLRHPGSLPFAGVFASVIAVVAEVIGHELGGTLYAIAARDGEPRKVRVLVGQFADGLCGSWVEAHDHDMNMKDMDDSFRQALLACPHLSKMIAFAIGIIFGTTERDLRRSSSLRDLMAGADSGRPRMWRPVADTPRRTLHIFEALAGPCSEVPPWDR